MGGFFWGGMGRGEKMQNVLPSSGSICLVFLSLVGLDSNAQKRLKVVAC